MILVGDIFDRIRRVFGNCSEELAYEKLNSAVEILRNEGNWNPLLGSMDICAQDCIVTFPDDVETPLAANVGGFPADFRNKWFEFHMNGPGTECCQQSCFIHWQDQGNFPTFRDIVDSQSKLLAVAEDSADNGLSLRAYGYDQNDKWIMQKDPDGTLSDGFEVPIFTTSLPVDQKIKRITRISKPKTRGFVRLVALDNASHNGTMIGQYRPGETEPNYRRAKISGPGADSIGGHSCTTWLRVLFRRKQQTVTTLKDPIFLHSQEAIIRACQAIRKYDADLFEEGDKYLQRAVAFLNSAEKANKGRRTVRMQFDKDISMGSGIINMI